MQISSALLEQGRQRCAATMNDPNRGVRDPIITPFVMAMKLGGYVEVLVGCCSKLRACPICPVGKGNYSQLYVKGAQTVWACPHCQNITAG
ncbi:hypothetical protein M2397_005892 [Pseudomonas sp. BIGb0381]|nr:hypothetical protein [Pseudomonas sp. BIGb0381]